MKVLCPACERLIELETFRLEAGSLLVLCQRCGVETRVAPTDRAAPSDALTMGAPLPTAAPRAVALPAPRVSLASVEGASNVVVLRTASHDAVAKAAAAADSGPFAVPEGLCPKCVARRVDGTEACPHCGILYEGYDEAALVPPKWLRDDWVALLRSWGNEQRHAALRRKAQQAEQLAGLGRLYRLRQANVPEDPIAAEGLSDVLRLAASSMVVRGEEDQRGGQPSRLLIIGGAVAAFLLLLSLAVMVLRA